MKYISYIFILLISFLVFWIDLPRPIPIRFTSFGQNINTEIRPLVINIQTTNFRYLKEFKTQLGLDLKGGSHLVFEADTKNISSQDLEDALNAARDVIERRVNLFGISEPAVRTIKSGDIYRISVDLPGVNDVAQASSLIGQTAQLHFKTQSTKDEESKDPESTESAGIALFNLRQETGLTGKNVKKASVTFDQQTGQPQVALEFTKDGGTMFAEITKNNIQKQVGIFLDDILISAPTVQQEIRDGNAVISGNFTTEGAKQLAVAINSGALPLPIRLVEQRSIGPTLGAIEVQKSVTAGIVGLGMVMIFMVAYYGRLGMIANAALTIYGLITFAIFRAVPIVLTLPGVAGFVLSIGMAVDSNILIFERIKEEQRKGKPFDTAIRLGFGRAIDAIKDANITTILVAFILFNPLNWEFLPQFGLVRGFALTLAIGVATSLFTGIIITRRLIQMFYKK
ncbi:MAG: Preprotein translocase subunit SecD [Candidatus Roizmanbacteria bacterium GW2011_GWA2_37_7]|uniref:Protein translocase subunit SecD n=1 Tax=Candidatus Roizmanbacteria bacterium GW2011_GWA2_37_7 TaxID=1618481 RepID=A0A0G0H426_9BACT|nr:MAG: Preprotein translocase subunit SecD [Candidatus Roizmanbacteria bacterium GW2011_GWA2_37_7]